MTDYTKIEKREDTIERLIKVRAGIDSDIDQFTEEYGSGSDPAAVNALLREFGNPEAIAALALERGTDSADGAEDEDVPQILYASAWLDGFVTAARLVTDRED